MSKIPPIKLLIVDDHPLLRKGLHEVEELDPNIKVVGEAGNGSEALRQTAILRPQVVLLDYRLPDMSGNDVCRRIKQKHPFIHILFLSSFAAKSMVRSAFDAGASGYLLKENGAQKIVDAIQTISRGGTVVDPMIASSLLAPETVSADEDSASRKLRVLSEQETRVLQEVATGKTDKEIADALGLQTKTVRNYLDHIFTKLAVHTRTQAAALFYRVTGNSDPL
jgi:DNA-binding NarL/FixJ family response regulator